MSASPTSAVPSTKRPLEDPSSPSGPNDQPDAKRPALDKVVKADERKAGDYGKTEVKDQEGSIDVPNGKGYEATLDARPVQSTMLHQDIVQTQVYPQYHAPQDETQWIHIRAVISSAEAATCIGKGGENVSQIRRLSGAKCTVSDYSRGAVERILTVSGPQDAVAKVCSLI